ncbi:periplasmic sensor signal transduction histidine kinase [Novosphingobium nitrogenifigens DSM 19370]|uniref:histidine kinase n=1 Tax=Novosphingobium nitrogenifigens DSM 19370 TaxID=983920 RepID=F1Z9G6_9SPHN|nr:HAMP domain-containing sensor histidine kinase [Novosphingobium nitrogenifigens]EGD58776.1 periplasmic sensor signal transduction histidine kinase [Novosphingobium nitrogenifigens DSM 19370]
MPHQAIGGPAAGTPHTGSLRRRMLLIAFAWISVLLLGGGVALDRTLTGLITRNFDDQLGYMLTAMVASAEIGPDGEVFFSRPLGDQRFLEPNSGLYWQISGQGHDDFPSRSLWDRTLKMKSDHFDQQPHIYDSDQFDGERLRIIERSVILPGNNTLWQFAVAASRSPLDAQLRRIRLILVWSFVVLGLGLAAMATLQTYYGLGPLRRVRLAIVRLREDGGTRVTEPLPLEVQPLVQELNALLAHSEQQAEEARTHAGNLAHALKTPLTVVTNAATAHADDLAETVIREAAAMRRHVDHHLARARAVGRRASGLSRATVWESVEAVLRAVVRLYPEVRFDLDGNREVQVAIERQDLDEILGNLIENAAKYGGGSVFITVEAAGSDARYCNIWIEDDGMGIPEEARERLFTRGARLDTGKPGTGLGLAIVRDVVELYGGSIELGESEDLGGLLVTLRLPRARQAK